MKLGSLLINYLIRRGAKAHGFLDPVNLLAQLSKFSQPSEIIVPKELLRSGALLHARGMINSQAIQHNLDWIWPYWVECQFDPNNEAFVPRAFSLTHINLTHRNWTAVGLANYSSTPIVDPRGLVMPFWDSWSIDFWLIDKDHKEESILPSKAKEVTQSLKLDDILSVTTETKKNNKSLNTKVFVEKEKEGLFCKIKIKAKSDKNMFLAIALRPHNPEGISFINTIEELKEAQGWLVNNKQEVFLEEKPQKYQLSHYRKGDVYHNLFKDKEISKIKCKVGMASAAALFKVEPNEVREISLKVKLNPKDQHHSGQDQLSWPQAVAGASKLDIGNKDFQNLYQSSLATVVLHTAGEAVAGPYTYKRFWFRDAVLIANALLSIGLKERANKIIKTFPQKQKVSGYFASQEGEWDSNGQVLWLLKQYQDLTNSKLNQKWKEVIKKGANWIVKKRLPDKDNGIHSGLMPSGFSAEHLGPSDYYYWDDFWSLGGLLAAADLMEGFEESDLANRFKEQAKSLSESIDKSLEKVKQRLNLAAIPAAPTRRMDSGAIGSMPAGYPLGLFEPSDKRLLATVEYLLQNCLVLNGFFHDMSHSGINPYLTLHIAQVLLRADDQRFYGLVKAIAGLASPTGQWPEAIHPHTRGGCMGDGQHVWAAAEWILMLRNSFLYKEANTNTLVLCSGIMPDWFQGQEEVSFKRAPSAFGIIDIIASKKKNKIIVSWQAQWYREQPKIKVRMPGFKEVNIEEGSQINEVTLEKI